MTSFALERIKEVKMLGLSENISSIIRGLRHAEVATSTVFRKLLIVRVVLCKFYQPKSLVEYHSDLYIVSKPTPPRTWHPLQPLLFTRSLR